MVDDFTTFCRYFYLHFSGKTSNTQPANFIPVKRYYMQLLCVLCDYSALVKAMHVPYMRCADCR
jgi:hypothetical protein